MRYFFIVLLVLVIWIVIDLHLGRKKRKQTPSLWVETTGDSTFIADGDDFFRKLLHDINQASTEIQMMFYIFRDDETGQKVIEHLCKKADAGVLIYLLVDYGGSHRLKKSTIHKMRSCGIHFSYSRKISFPHLFTSLNERNHRKITVIDGNVGYVGGFNVGNEYAGKDPKFGYWRDYHVRLTGEAVKGLQDQFILDWKENSSFPIEALSSDLQKGPKSITFHITNGNAIEEAFASYIDKATTSIKIGTPYYIPGQTVQTSLLRALKCGVSVQMILPMRADHPLVKEASYPYLVELIQAGCEVYQYMNGFYHAKVIVIDDTFCDVGTANFDQRSFHINGEINSLFHSTAFVTEVKEVLEKDLLQSERLDLARLQDRTIGNRVLSPIARLLSPFL